MPFRFPLLAAALLAAALPAAAQRAPAPPAFTQRDKGHCTACHQVPEGAGPASRADMGPRLEGARMRELGRARLREVIHDPTRANPDTVMPPFGKHRILEPAEIDRIVEYLHALP
jgi:sulfur-oxidizing protein SoxX